MAPTVYILGTLVSFACAILLFRSYRRGGKGLLLWGSLCFTGMTISNGLIFVDLVIIPAADLYLLRLLTAAIAILLLVFGLIWETE
jgi:hypothetical protein